jgi:hypothetical protein
MKKYILSMLFLGLFFGLASAQNEISATQNGAIVSLDFKEGVSIAYKLYQIDPIAGEYIHLESGEISATSNERTIQYETVAGGLYQLDYQVVDEDAKEASDLWFHIDPLSLLAEGKE